MSRFWNNRLEEAHDSVANFERFNQSIELSAASDRAGILMAHRAGSRLSAQGIAELYQGNLNELLTDENFAWVWGSIETTFLQQYFSLNPNEQLDIEIPDNLHTFASDLTYANITARGELRGHLGFKATLSQMKLVGRAAFVGSGARKSDFVVKGDVTDGLGPNAEVCTFDVRGKLPRHIGQHARKSYFTVRSASNELARSIIGDNAHNSRFQIRGSTIHSVGGSSVSSVFNIDGDALGPIGTRSVDCDVTVTGQYHHINVGLNSMRTAPLKFRSMKPKKM